jgi:hypothetical protein
MEKDSTTKFIGLDVHSKTISVAIADEGRKGEVRHYVYPSKVENRS